MQLEQFAQSGAAVCGRSGTKCTGAAVRVAYADAGHSGQEAELRLLAPLCGTFTLAVDRLGLFFRQFKMAAIGVIYCKNRTNVEQTSG